MRPIEVCKILNWRGVTSKEKNKEDVIIPENSFCKLLYRIDRA